MKPRDIVLAAAVAVIWGLAFVVSKVGLRELSPLALCAMRFMFAAIPCLFVPRPRISWLLLIGISATWFVGQFVTQFYGIAHGVPAGLTAVIVQSQALFTVALAALVFGEIPSRMQVAGIAVAAMGLAMVCATVGYDFSIGAFAVTMISPLSFAVGNLLLRRARDARMFDLVAWLSILVPLPLAAVALLSDGVEATVQSFSHLSLSGLGAAALLGVVSTTLAYWAWGHLLQRYTAAQVVPFALLVPVVASIASVVLFGEQFGTLRLAGMATLVVGVAIMLVLGRSRAAPAAVASPHAARFQLIMSQLALAFVIFASVALYTPGPNNIMLMASGLNFGLRRTLPHIVGVNVGFSVLVTVIGLGLGAAFETWPVLQTILKYAGAAYLVYLAVMIAMGGPHDAAGATSTRPMTFFGAAMFQWVNVKGWVIAVGTITTYAAIAVYPWNILTLVSVLFVIGLSASAAWALFGASLQAVIKSPRAVRVFNVAMAILLLASLYPVLAGA